MRYGFSRRNIFFIAGVSLVCLTSCQIIDPYQSPRSPTPETWKTDYAANDAGQPIMPQEWKNQKPAEIHEAQNIPTPLSSEPTLEEVRAHLTNWWHIFNDPALNRLEEEALNNSYTLWAALERVVQYRALAAIQHASLAPGVTFDPSYSKVGQLLQNPFSTTGNGTGPTITPLNQCARKTLDYGNTNNNALSALNIQDYRFVQTQYLIPLNLNYEIDLWGRLNNAYYAALVRAQAASQAYCNVLLSLTADIASSYFQIRGFDSQLFVIEKNIRTRQEEVDINQARYRAGLIAYVDVTRAQTELAIAKSDRDNIQRLRGLQENMLAALIGTPAPLFSLDNNPVILVPPKIPTGIPSELLCRRYDIAKAERLLAAFYYEIGVAKANFFPSLSINAAIGLESPFSHLLSDWRARFWQIGLNIMQTVFDAGRNQANFEYYQSLYRESFSHYQQTVVNAFQDVEDALVNLKFYAVQSDNLTEAVKAARQTSELSQLRYNQGLVNYLDVVDAERRLLETEQNLTVVLGNRYIATVQLIRALGGGWNSNVAFEEETN